MFLQNAWYLAATSDQLDADGKVALTLLGEPVVIYRRSDGSPVALEDRCVHRMAQLSLGRVEGNNLRCMYHGLLFNPEGRVVEIPGQDTIPPRACVRNYPVAEISGWIWVWPGDAAQADIELVPPVQGARNPEWIMRGGNLDYACEYRLINDNLTDLGHLSWVHSQSFGADSSWSLVPPKVSALPRAVRFERWLKDIAPIPPLGKAAGHERVDHWTHLEYHVPGVFSFYNALYPAGTADSLDGAAPSRDDPRLLLEHYTQQAVTPLTETTSRYVFIWGPSAATGTAEDAEVMRQVLAVAFQEDKVMIEAQQRVINLDPTRQPMPIVHDKGVILFQRIMQRLMREERGEAVGAQQASLADA